MQSHKKCKSQTSAKTSNLSNLSFKNKISNRLSCGGKVDYALLKQRVSYCVHSI